jgi:hypothetical protein
MYARAVLNEISTAHRSVELALFRNGIKNLVFLGGGAPGEPCLTEISGVDRRYRPPVVEFDARFPQRRTILAWNPSSEGYVLERKLRFSMDADGRPSAGTTVEVTTELADFVGVVHHLRNEWSIRWTYTFHDAPKPPQEQKAIATQTA